MGGDPGRVARFDDIGAPAVPAAQARLDTIGADDEPAATVAEFAAGTAPEDAAPVADLADPGTGPGGPDAAGRPDDPDVAVGDPSGAPGAAARVAALDHVDGPQPGAPRTARFGDTARGGRSGAQSRSTTSRSAAPPAHDTERSDDDSPGRSGTERSGARSSGFTSSGFGSSGSGASRSRSGFGSSGFGSQGFGGRKPRGRAATRRAEADAAARAEGTGDEPAAEATPAPRRGFGPKQIDPDADPVAAAREICLRLLTDRSRTRHELAQALKKRGVPDDVADAVLSRFDEVGLIDDVAFAGQYVRSRHTYSGLSRRAIAMELRRKGVDDEVAGEALEEVDDDSEARRARELVDRKLRTVPADTPEQRKKAANRLVGMLARKGYGGGIAYRVVREALAAHGAEIDDLGTDPVD